MARESFAKQVLKILCGWAVEYPQGVTVDQLSIGLGLKSRPDHKRMLNALSDHHKAGRVLRVRQGVYLPTPPNVLTKPPEKRQVMWSLLKWRKVVSVDDLVELAGVSEDYAAEWLRMLEKHGQVKRNSDTRPWRLLGNPGEMPIDDQKADRLQAMRKRKHNALVCLELAQKAILQARRELNEIED